MSKIITEVQAYDLISQLGKELVVEYEAENETITTIVTDLLNFQVLTPPITVGTISSSYSGLTRSIKVDGDTILRALFRLRDTVGGYIYVDNDRKLQWTDSLGEDKGQQIRYKKNLNGIERSIDYNSLVNRLYCYGAGEGTARIKLSDATGQTEDYIEDTTSQTEWGGVYVGVKVDKSITHPDTLLAWANLKLAEVKDPVITYQINTVDLSESNEDFSFESLQLGSTVKVIDEELGIDVETTVVKIEHPDLLHPEQMNLELSTRVKDITDTLLKVYDRQQFDQHIATTIGAGQVVVKGAFVVQDWVTAGATTIVGSNIETGTVEANAIKTSTLTSRTITLSGADSILKGNYVAGSTGWQIKGDGNAEFNDVTVRGTVYATAGEFTGTLKVSNIEAGATLTVNGTIESSNYSAGTAGWIIDGGGSAEFNDVTVRGNIQAGTGSAISYGYINGGPPSDADVTLSALNGGLSVTGGGITLSNGGAIKGGQTDYNSGTGFFLGYSSGYKFSVGNSSGNRFTWDGTTLTTIGTIKTGTSGKRVELSNDKLSFYDGNNYLAFDLDAGTYGAILTQHYQGNNTGQWYNIDGSNSYLTSQGILHLESAGNLILNSNQYVKIGTHYVVGAYSFNHSILQVGSGALSSGSAHIDLPENFNTSCTPLIVVTPKGSGANSLLYVDNASYNGFDVETVDTDCSFDWIAIGYI